MRNITLALDAMGGDHGPSVVVPAALAFAAKNPDCRLVLVGRQDAIEQHIPESGLPEQISLQHASQLVGMDELPSFVLRNKKDSSMRVSINLVKQGVANACISAGNTGALMATARFVLKTIPGIDRPAIISAFPSINGHTWVLDLGANIDSTAEHLRQFAVMGSVLVAAVDDNAEPAVGLLNIGQEEIKGIEQVKLAHKMMNCCGLNYIGYVEGDDIYMKQGLDIVVTDGFTGNVALKSSEGVAKLIKSFLNTAYKRNWATRIAAFLSLPVLKSLRERIDPRRYNGAPLLGLQGIVVKSHGGADAVAFEHALNITKKEVLADVASRISDKVTTQLALKESA